MDILEFRLRVIMALRMAGLSEAQAEVDILHSLKEVDSQPGG